MSDTTEAATTTTNAENKPFTLADVERRYFSPSEVEDAAAYIAKIEAIPGLDPKDVKRNHDLEGEGLPEGYGVAILPINKRAKDADGEPTTITTGIGIFAVPDFATIAETERGQEFIRSVVMDQCMNKAANSVRPRTAGAAPVSMPFTLEDFIESRRGSGNLKTFTELAPIVVKFLKKKGAPHMTSKLLKNTLASATFAEQQFPKTEQPVWVKLLESMIGMAREQGLDPAILHSWLNTRNEADVDEMELDMEDLEGLIAE